MAYGTTKRSDLVIPEILVEAIQGEFAGKPLLFGSGAAVVSNTMPAANNGGDTVTVPYFGTLGEMEDIGTEGDALTPEKISMSRETATVVHSGKAFERTEWSRLAERGDAYAEAARQFGIIAQRRADKALIDVATASLSASYIHDVSGEDAGGTLNYDRLVDATGKWGDQQERIVLMGVHSKVRRDLLKLKDSTGRPLFTLPTEDDDVPRFMGIPVVVSDKCKTIDAGGGVTKYESIVIKEAALAFWYQEEPRVLTGQDILADTEIVAVHMYWAAHRYLRVRGSTHPGVVKIVSK